MYINLFNWLVKVRTIKVSVLYDTHERSNSTFWEISIRQQRDVVKVRIFEKVKTCCSLDSHPNRNRSYETSQIRIRTGASADPSLGRWWRCLRAKEKPAQEPQLGLETLDPAKLCFPAPLGSGAGLGVTFTFTFARSGPYLALNSNRRKQSVKREAS